jgi:glutathione S-transferase
MRHSIAKGVEMKLYYSPGACSLAAHIVLREGGFKFELDKVDLQTKKTAAGEDYLTVNPKGYVPALRLDSGEILTEAGTIVQYLADQKQALALAPKLGTMERYRLMEWINFISTEIHKGFGPLWKPNTPEVTREAAIETLGQRFTYLSEQLKNKQFLTGDKFTIADAYLFTVINWTNIHKIDLSKWPILQTFMTRVKARPQVQETLKAEGMI